MYIGIDLGGTNIKAGIVNSEGKITIKKSIPTHAEREYPEIVRDMAELCFDLIKEAGISKEDIEGVGIGSPGEIDHDAGTVIYANNLKMNNAEIVKEFKKHFDTKVSLENDANAAAYGEYTACGEDCDSFVCMTLGTGVGGGIIIDRKIYRGFNGIAAELGHTILVKDGRQCSCGRKGCLEAYASVSALIEQTREAMEKYPGSMLDEIAEEEGHVSGKTAFIAARKKDAVGRGVVKAYTEYVAEGAINLITLLQPKKLIIGGAISREGDFLLDPIKEYINKSLTPGRLPKTEIAAATLFNDAGIIGAALSCKNL